MTRINEMQMNNLVRYFGQTIGQGNPSLTGALENQREFLLTLKRGFQEWQDGQDTEAARMVGQIASHFIG